MGANTYRKTPAKGAAHNGASFDDGWAVYRNKELLAVVDTETMADALLASLKDPAGYAEVVWMPGDVKSIRPRWSLKKCEARLAAIESHLRDRTIELGWDVMETLLTMDGP